jgi:hypothetical protein
MVTASLLIVALGQTTVSAANADDVKQVNITFRCLILSQDAYWEMVNIHERDGEPKYIDFNSAFVSERPITYVGSNPLRIYSEDKLIASVEIPEEAEDIFILLRSAPANETVQGKPPLIAHVIDSAAFDFPPGSYLIINLTDRQVGALIGGVDQVIQSEEISLLTLDLDENSNIEARFREEIDGQWVRSYQLAWYFRPTNRQVVILGQTPNGKMIITSRQVRGWGKPE